MNNGRDACRSEPMMARSAAESALVDQARLADAIAGGAAVFVGTASDGNRLFLSLDRASGIFLISVLSESNNVIVRTFVAPKDQCSDPPGLRIGRSSLVAAALRAGLTGLEARLLIDGPEKDANCSVRIAVLHENGRLTYRSLPGAKHFTIPLVEAEARRVRLPDGLTASIAGLMQDFQRSRPDLRVVYAQARAHAFTVRISGLPPQFDLSDEAVAALSADRAYTHSQ